MSMTPKQAVDILTGEAVLTSESERRQALKEIANMIEELAEKCYLLEERIAIMTEGVVNDG